jgi:hypothetical protein
MARNGSGTFSRPVSDYQNGTVISETAVNSEFDGISVGLTDSLAKDGQTVPTANLPMGTYRHTGVGNGVARTDYAAMGQLQDSTPQWLGNSSGTNTVTASATPAIASYAAGQTFRFKAGGTNTGAVTLNLNSLGAKAVQKRGAALVAGDITANNLVEAAYDGTQFQLISPTAVNAASTSVSGIVELATTSETATGSDSLRAVTPEGLHDMSSLAGAAWFLDEDAMGTNSDVKVPSQQSVKAYVTSSIAASPPGRVKIIDTDWSSGTPSSVTFEDADGMDWSTYSYFEMELSGLISASCRLICTMSQSGAYETGSTDYHSANVGQQFTATFYNGTTGINIPNVSNQIYKGSAQYNEMFHLKASLYPGLSDGTNIDGPYIHWSLASSVTGSGNRAHANGTGALRNLVATAIDGIKFEQNTGNMPNGSFKVWGIV